MLTNCLETAPAGVMHEARDFTDEPSGRPAEPLSPSAPGMCMLIPASYLPCMLRRHAGRFLFSFMVLHLFLVVPNYACQSANSSAGTDHASHVHEATADTDARNAAEHQHDQMDESSQAPQPDQCSMNSICVLSPMAVPARQVAGVVNHFGDSVQVKFNRPVSRVGAPDPPPPRALS